MIDEVEEEEANEREIRRIRREQLFRRPKPKLSEQQGDVMERREWTVSQRAVAYLVCASVVNGAYWPDEIKEWAQGLMRGEQRVGVQLVRESIADNQHTTLVEQRDKLVEALKGVAIMLNTELERYEQEPWAQRVRNALATVEQGEGRES